jgi:hypothetical protein
MRQDLPRQIYLQERPASGLIKIRSEQTPVRRNFGAALAGKAAFSGAADAKSTMDATLLESAKQELRVCSINGVESGLTSLFPWKTESVAKGPG